MSAVLVDSSVLIDVATDNPAWTGRSRTALKMVGRDRELVINSIIFAEVSIPFDRIEDIDERLPRDVFRREEVPRAAAFLAGKAFLSYRRNKGARRSPLPDFFIGAHAAARGYAVLTRDPGSFRTYFPTIEVLVPEEIAQ
jgi:predicted nucleic acid-binding protein